MIKIATTAGESGLIDKIKNFYQNFGAVDLNQLPNLYEQDARFVDPVHALEGLADIESYFRAGRVGLLACVFEYRSDIVSDQAIALEWDMRFRHRKLRGGNEIVVQGGSFFYLNHDGSRIARHIDYYDLGGMLYEQVPLLGAIIHKLKKNLAS